MVINVTDIDTIQGYKVYDKYFARMEGCNNLHKSMFGGSASQQASIIKLLCHLK